MYSLKMAKKVCEDWAGILLNERTKIISPKNQEYLDKIFKDISFWDKINTLIEKTFYSGTGAIVLHMNNMKLGITGESIQDKGTQINFEYLSAMNIIPLSLEYGKVIDVAFVSERIEKGKNYIYLEIHTKTNNGYRIENKRFEIDNNSMTEISLNGVASVIEINSKTPLFALISPNIVSPYDNSNGLGVAVFDNAINNLKGVDLAFNNFNKDFFLGGKKVFYNQEMVMTKIDKNGHAHNVAPDEVGQQLFYKTGDVMGDEATLLQEYNPSLRVQENTAGIQAQLDYLSLMVGFGTKHYQFNSGSIVTATQYMGDKQELIQHANKHMLVLESALISITKAVLWVAKNIQGENVDTEDEIEIEFEDGFIIDTESERLRDKEDVRDGLMQKWEYVVKWRGVDKEVAKSLYKAESDDQILFGGE